MLHLSFCGTISSFYCSVGLFTSAVFYHRRDTKVDRRDILLWDGAGASPLITNHIIHSFTVRCVVHELYFRTLLVHRSAKETTSGAFWLK